MRRIDDKMRRIDDKMRRIDDKDHTSPSKNVILDPIKLYHGVFCVDI